LKVAGNTSLTSYLYSVIALYCLWHQQGSCAASKQAPGPAIYSHAPSMTEDRVLIIFIKNAEAFDDDGLALPSWVG